jgi:hypothetical protein
MNHLDSNDELLFFFEEKHAALKRYLSITRKMDETTSSIDHRKLKKLMSDRQNCMRKIQTVDKSIASLLRSGTNKINRFSHKTKGLFDKHIQYFKHIMEEIIPIDKRIYLLVKNEDTIIKNQLLAFRKNKHAVNSYRTQPRMTPRYLDTKK